MGTNKLIVFEGICCSGKTTLAKLTSQYLNGEYLKGAVSEGYIGKIVKEKYQFELNFSDSFYISDLIAHTDSTIKPMLKEDRYVIQDRYSDSIGVFSNSCFQLQNTFSYNIDSQLDYLITNELLLTPVKYIYLYASKQTIINRLSMNPLGIHRFYLENPLMIDYVLNEYSKKLKSKKYPVLILKTDELSIDQSLNQIKKYLIN